MQRFSVSLEDAIADQLRVTAARQRTSVSEFVAGLVSGALSESARGEPGAAGSAEKRPVRRPVPPTASEDGLSPEPSSPPSIDTLAAIPGVQRASDLVAGVDPVTGEIVDVAVEPFEEAP